MKNIRSLEKSELLQCTQDLVATEIKTTMALIEHLREIDRRLLFLEMGFSSLFEFCVKHLGLSEGSTQRRISAMKLIRDIPEAKQKLESGEMTLSNASQVQTVFRTAKLSIAEKKETLDKISGMTQKECQSVLLTLVPEAAPKLLERARQVTNERFELKLVVSKDLHDQIQELKNLLSHSLHSGGTTELLEHLVSEELRRQKKKRGISEKRSEEQGQRQVQERGREQRQEGETHKLKLVTAAAVQTETVRSRKHIPVRLRREIWKRAQTRCEAVDHGKRCSSQYRLELDHIIPYGQGGGDSPENLRLLCRAHNIRHAIESYGEETMGRFCRP
jgi:5-methylcytosine-specific restriction endonuclease McrA